MPVILGATCRARGRDDQGLCIGGHRRTHACRTGSRAPDQSKPIEAEVGLGLRQDASDGLHRPRNFPQVGSQRVAHGI